MKNAALAAFLAAVSVCAAPAARAARRPPPLRPWYSSGTVCYEIFVRSFFDSDGDGIGDLKGLISRLDYVNDGNPDSKTSLGATCIWLMPVAASPSYHGYDVTDYEGVNPAYGTLADFQALVADVHGRGMRIIIDLVLNHTSSRHPWFLASRDPASMHSSTCSITSM